MMSTNAIMYVEDTDLLHLPASPSTDPKELVAHAQGATTDYGCLAQASLGILKGDKFSVYFMEYTFV
jgi:hypothetical protein